MPFRTRPDGRLELVCPCGCGAVTEWKEPKAPGLIWRGKRDRSIDEILTDYKVSKEPPIPSVGEIFGRSSSDLRRLGRLATRDVDSEGNPVTPIEEDTHGDDV